MIPLLIQPRLKATPETISFKISPFVHQITELTLLIAILSVCFDPFGRSLRPGTVDLTGR